MKKTTISALILIMVFALSTFAQSNSSDDRPNFLLIVADDMGFSDLGSFGGEINTPNLDALAEQGVRYSNYYVAPTCSPTRSMLLSGMDNHLAGLGNMYERMAPNQEGEPGYEGVLNDRVATLPEILKENGYHTYMAGKWHLGKEPHHIPRAKGFERDFTLLDAAGSHFNMDPNNSTLDKTQFTEDGIYINELPDDYYSTKTYTEKMISFIENNKDDDKPFFAYMAYQAPHDPLQVPDDWLRKYKGKYDEGWDIIRQRRMERLIELGFFDEGTVKAPRLWYVPEFEDLTGVAQFTIARKMELYAAMVEYLDMQIGVFLDYLDSIGELNNTYIIFFSDNGAESRDPAGSLKGKKALAAAGWIGSTFEHHFNAWGREGSIVAYGSPWANVSATPLWMVKGAVNEGGVRSPLIIVEPGNTNGGQINKEALLHVKDVAPTLLDLAGIKQPSTFKGKEVLPMQGLSWKSMISGEIKSPRSEDDWIGMEWWSGRFIRKGDWKLLWMPEPVGIDGWELFNLSKDIGEQNNVADLYPEKLNELKKHWDEFVVENNIIIPNRTQFDGMEDQLPPKPPILLDSWPPPSEPNYEEETEDGNE